MMSSVWSVLLLVKASTLFDLELQPYLRHGGLDVAPLILFLCGIIFVALGVMWWVYAVLFDKELGWMIASFVVVGMICLHSLYLFVVSIRSLFKTRNETIMAPRADMPVAQLRQQLACYAANELPGLHSLPRFKEFLLQKQPGSRFSPMCNLQIDKIFEDQLLNVQLGPSSSSASEPAWTKPSDDSQ